MFDHDVHRRTIAAESLDWWRTKRSTRRAYVHAALRIDPASPEGRILSPLERQESKMLRGSMRGFLRR